jgi:prepilin-type N-terminal cleavage/methylation domain-containing protein
VATIFVDLFLMKINMFYPANKKGFTIIELLVTVSIIAILMAVAIGSFGPAREKSRDAQRQTDLRTVEAALALYKNKYGEYPAGCNPPTTGTTPSWSGQPGSGYECNPTSTQYIVGLAPEFIPKLPTDPRLNADETYSGYVYTTNADQSVYKLMALNTVETENVDSNNAFFRCGQDLDQSTASLSHDDPQICERSPQIATGSYNAQVSKNNECSDSDLFQTTYAISAGFSTDSSRNASQPLKSQEYDTENVRCR